MERHKARPLDLTTLFEGHRFHQPAVEEIIQLGFANPAIGASLRDAEPVMLGRLGDLLSELVPRSLQSCGRNRSGHVVEHGRRRYPKITKVILVEWCTPLYTINLSLTLGCGSHDDLEVIPELLFGDL